MKKIDLIGVHAGKFCTCFLGHGARSFNSYLNGSVLRCYKSTKFINTKSPGFLLKKQTFNSVNSLLQGIITKRFYKSTTGNFSKCLYQVLNVQKSDSKAEITKAYNEAVKKYHPEYNNEPGAAKRFWEIQQSYLILSDERKRGIYDNNGEFNMEDNLDGNFDGGNGFSSSFGKFQQEIILNLTFLEAANGLTKHVKVPVLITCSRCEGEKTEPGTTIEFCPHCNGTGEQHIQTSRYKIRTVCMVCEGYAKYISNPCISCKGQGLLPHIRNIPILIPPGVGDGHMLIVPIHDMQLFVKIKIIPCEFFTRNGEDITSDMYISFTQAILGGEVKTQGIEEELQLTISPGTQSHQICFAGKGINKLNGHGRGDHYVNIKIETPNILSKDQKDLIEEYAELDVNTIGTVNGVEIGRIRNPLYNDSNVMPHEKEDWFSPELQRELGMIGLYLSGAFFLIG